MKCRPGALNRAIHRLTILEPNRRAVLRVSNHPVRAVCVDRSVNVPVTAYAWWRCRSLTGPRRSRGRQCGRPDLMVGAGFRSRGHHPGDRDKTVLAAVLTARERDRHVAGDLHPHSRGSAAAAVSTDWRGDAAVTALKAATAAVRPAAGATGTAAGQLVDGIRRRSTRAPWF